MATTLLCAPRAWATSWGVGVGGTAHEDPRMQLRREEDPFGRNAARQPDGIVQAAVQLRAYPKKKAKPPWAAWLLACGSF